MASGFTTSGSDFDAQFIRREFFREGTLWGWGQNSYGTLGNGSASSSNKFSSPIIATGGGLIWNSIYTDGSAGNVVIGYKTNGSVWCWGQNLSNQLGTGTATTYTAPTQMSPVAYRTNWKKIAVTSTHSVGIWNNTMWSVGANSYGQLGDGTIATKSTWTTQIAGLDWSDVSVCRSASSAIKTDGTLWTWGRNNYGQLADNTTTNKSSPVQIYGGGTNWKYLQKGGFGSQAAIKTDGTLWLWGHNDAGQLGVNDITNRSSPTQIIGGGNWKQTSFGGWSTATSFTGGIKSDNTLWMWGANVYGQLGNSSTTKVSSPVQIIGGGTNWKQVSTGNQHTAAVKTDGTLWTWGRNNYGQLGDNTIVNKSSPIQTIAGGTNWKSVQIAYHTTLALTDNNV
jgi:alpha-tubulin suppressor-like RCC1 family protein